MKSSETFKKVFAYIKKYHFFLLLSFVLSIVAVVTQLYIHSGYHFLLTFSVGKRKSRFSFFKKYESADSFMDWYFRYFNLGDEFNQQSYYVLCRT